MIQKNIVLIQLVAFVAILKIFYFLNDFIMPMLSLSI